MTAQVIVDIAHSQVDKIFEYNCPMPVEKGSRVKVPFGSRLIDGVVIALNEQSDFDGQLKDIASVLDDIPAITAECLALTETIRDRYRTQTALVLRLFLPSEMRKGKVRELIENYCVLAGGIDADKAAESLGKAAVKQRAAIIHLAKIGEEKLSVLNAEFGGGAVKALRDKDIIAVEGRKKARIPYESIVCENENRRLTKAQLNAIDEISSGKNYISLLHGVTGSGKTEVYLNLINKTIQKGKSAIFLVPEISLTPQMLKELRSRFKDNVAIMHSGLSAGERFDEWWRLRTGEAKIAVGARSAVFAPLENLGIIVLDEEHDGSYFSETSPRYSTLDIAKLRAKYNGCKLILGSATPSVESYLKATENKYNLVKLPDRINEQALPEFIIADMRIEARRGNISAFSTQLKQELEKCLQSASQAIIFLNRRGYARQIICQKCGYVAKCEECDVSLTYHSDENSLKCHYCEKRYKMLTACPECKDIHIRLSGTGTQRVSAELQKLFPNAKILRMDNDTTKGKEGHINILRKFVDKKADILVGTQMVAKGHNFPSVTLVGILDADMSLHFSDYRSRERTFQLLTQVSGRSGRGKDKGLVVLQTYSPDDEVLKYATSYNYEKFFHREIALRQATLFPPFAKIVRVMVTSPDRDKAVKVLKDVYYDLEDLYINNKDSFVFFNKMNSPIKRLQNSYRFQVLMRITDESLVGKVYDLSLKHKNRDVLVYIEENPSSLS